jgi:hypothetical protein
MESPFPLYICTNIVAYDPLYITQIWIAAYSTRFEMSHMQKYVILKLR